METSYLNTDKCKFESSQKDESRAQSPDSPKACSKARAFTGNLRYFLNFHTTTGLIGEFLERVSK